jgi:hypothetical protein
MARSLPTKLPYCRLYNQLKYTPSTSALAIVHEPTAPPVSILIASEQNESRGCSRMDVQEEE